MVGWGCQRRQLKDLTQRLCKRNLAVFDSRASVLDSHHVLNLTRDKWRSGLIPTNLTGIELIMEEHKGACWWIYKRAGNSPVGNPVGPLPGSSRGLAGDAHATSE